jgi:hypothetical protein
MIETFNEVTTKVPVKAEDGNTTVKLRPNPSGIASMLIRFLKRLKASLD